MKKLVIRNSSLFGEIRLVNVGGVYHAVLSDIAKALGNKKSVISSSNCKSIVKYPVPTNGGSQMMNVVSANDVQRIIIKSRMPFAEEFEEWANKELLPFMKGSH
ncbi:Bro-N domain-containing protein [Sporosarcina psychrophila]|uniref:BRO-N domain-containing protein n=1 Tax=Sporosarcina psychrophila TaxID=1476 RepID=UPI00078E9A93|nr:BRO family protein [Sporosarcina psychrophila]AMQ05901.1 hypothetical protein AZE41_08215 [Sporosarcina psychrophila]